MNFVVAWASGKKEITYRDDSGAEIKKTNGSRSWRNNNPGNIIKGSFSESHDAIGNDKKFAIFPDESIGRDAIIALFLGNSYKNLTIYDAFYRYTPPSDNNDTEAYIAAVTRALGVPSSTIIKSLSHAQLEDLSDAIKVHEGWREGQISGLDGKRMRRVRRGARGPRISSKISLRSGLTQSAVRIFAKKPRKLWCQSMATRRFITPALAL
jgi:hypothetical protein